jgi:exodeoxyribonuclease V gamma subunit
VLHLHRSERADVLVEMLGDLLAEPLDDPLAAEVVAVPTQGVERWLSQQLSKRLGTSRGRSDGACGNVDMPFPGTLVGRVVAGATGVDPDEDPWSPDRAVWHLVDIIDTNLDQPWLAALAAHLKAASPEERRFAAVRHVADLFDRYGVHRPEMLLDWLAGRDDLEPQDRWQAALWRALRERTGALSPPERTLLVREHLAEVDLPERVSLFGMTRLPASYLDVLATLSKQRDVHLFLLHPSPAVWSRIAGSLGRPGLRRRDNDVASRANHALLRSWGQDALEMQVVLAHSLDPREQVDHHRPVPDAATGPATLLARIQADVRADLRPAGSPRHGEADRRVQLEDDDDSIRIHSCHGRARQVEVLRDAVLHLFSEHPDLEPRDVVVMCPDIETYAPLIHATFGSAAGDEESSPLGDLRVRLADRSLRQTNPLLGVVAQLLELAAGRVTASQVLDLAGKDPVRRRFGFGHEDLARLAEWVAGAGIRWGLDAAHRAPFKLERLEANSWRSGLDRALLGVAMADEGQRSFGGAVPLDDVDSGDIDLVGRLSELVERLGTAVRALAGRHRVDEWAAILLSSVEDLTATSDEDAWQAAQLRRLLEEVADRATVAGEVVRTRLGLADVAALLADRLRGRPTRANFRTGHLTICTLVPMRSVPHRVVCLLGLDDGAFPRHPERDGDDLVLRDPHVGDRDARSEDRQLVLDALLAATDHLVVTFTGRDERTNLARPPAVPLGELIDVIDRTAVCAGGRRARDQVLVHHPLQPFDPRCFVAGALTGQAPWSFDQVNLAGARALSSERREPAPFLSALLAEPDLSTIELVDLERFVRHPVRAFLRQRLGISLGFRDKDLDDALPVDLDGLQSWEVGERLLGARLAGSTLAACVAAERARGQLPPGDLADTILDDVTTGVEQLVAATVEWAAPTSLDVNLTLPDGTSLVGTVAGVRGDVLQRVTYSRLAPVQRLVVWTQLMALTAARPEQAFSAIAIGRPPDGASNRARVSISSMEALGPDPERRAAVAVANLELLVDLYRRGMREPLPLYAKSSAAWAIARRDATLDPREEAGRAWRGDRFGGEDRDAEHKLVLGTAAPFDQLLAELPREADQGPGWMVEETTRLGRYARRMWDGLLEREAMRTA